MRGPIGPRGLRFHRMPLYWIQMNRVAVGLVAIAIGMQGCSPAPKAPAVTSSGPSSTTDSEAVKILKSSMDTYAGFSSFQADCDWSAKVPGNVKAGDEAKNKRTLAYARPNKFKVVTDMSERKFVLTCVSDGKKLAEYSTGGGLPGQTYPAPENIWSGTTMQLSHPMFCGTVLYDFFAGSQGYGAMVDVSKAPPSLGAVEKAPNGEEAVVVKFYAKDTYGNVQALIGRKSGLVYRIVYDSQGLRELIESQPDSVTKGQKLPEIVTSELYSNIKTGQDLTADKFDTKLPAGVESAPVASEDPNASPFPLGKPVPDFQVASLNGTPVKLSSLKGHPVLIDFWATWCGPCKLGLPVTDKLSKELGPKGLQVLAISAEEKDTVSKFVAENNYKFNACIDAGGATNQAYKVQGIPTTVIIDAKGNLVSYLVGLREEGEIRQELKKVGL